MAVAVAHEADPDRAPIQLVGGRRRAERAGGDMRPRLLPVPAGPDEDRAIAKTRPVADQEVVAEAREAVPEVLALDRLRRAARLPGVVDDDRVPAAPKRRGVARTDLASSREHLDARRRRQRPADVGEQQQTRDRGACCKEARPDRSGAARGSVGVLRSTGPGRPARRGGGSGHGEFQFAAGREGSIPASDRPAAPRLRPPTGTPHASARLVGHARGRRSGLRDPDRRVSDRRSAVAPDFSADRGCVQSRRSSGARRGAATIHRAPHRTRGHQVEGVSRARRAGRGRPNTSGASSGVYR